jgi:hypothetical protein
MSQIVISKEKPPIYDALVAKFNVNWDTGLIVAYDGKIHSKDYIAPQKIIHERTHLDRQATLGNDVWWKLYLDNDVFRFEEEVLAYKAEANFIKKNIKNREDRFHMIRDIAICFSSDMYGKMITQQEALTLLL